VLAVGILVAVLVVGAIVVVAVGRGDVMADAPPDRPDPGLPDHRPIAAADLPRLRFSMGLRGYRMNEVDAALERIGSAMAGLEQEVAELRVLARRTPPAKPPTP
jgi:DivIVA domain-containing protein